MKNNVQILEKVDNWQDSIKIAAQKLIDLDYRK